MTKMENKLSLVASFDDLMRCATVLNTGCEAEFRSFVLNQEDNRRRWLESEQKVESLEDKVKRLQSENAKLDTQVKHARNQVQYELSRRNEAEQERSNLERQLDVIRELLTDKNSKSQLHEVDRERLHSLYNSYVRNSQVVEKSPTGKLNTIMESSASMLSDISYDKTEDDLEHSHLRSGRKWKRPSAPPMEDMDERNGNTPPKRTKEDLDSSVMTTTTTITVDGHGKPVSATTEVTVPKLNKSFSEPNLDKYGDSDDEVWESQGNRNNNRGTSKKGILKKTPETPALRKASSAGKGLNRVHVFISRTVIKPTTCVPCGKNIRFGKVAMKCKDCRASCHLECKDKLPLPCIPSAPSTPGTAKLTVGILADFAPAQRPMIPRLIVNCANEIERRGLSEVGIYRVPGSDREAKDLKEKFLKGKCPNLSNLSDIHSVCGCLKDFIRNLKEPLLTFALWPLFVRAAGGLGHHVVMTVGKNYLGKGHHFYHDNFFTSIALADELLAEKTRSCGTIRMNRKGWPADLKVKAGKGKKKMSRGEALFRQLGQLVATLWQDKRPIAFLSTNANPVMGIARRHIGKENNNPQMSRDILCEAINNLPTANRDTLAFLVQHLQRVADSTETKMPASNLAKVFGPTVVGYSCPEPEPMQMISETRKQAMVMEKLLELPTDFWCQILDVEDISLYPAEAVSTPDSPSRSALRSRLGPVLTPGTYEKYTKTSTWSEKTQHTPRYASKTMEPRKVNQFFQSPFAN